MAIWRLPAQYQFREYNYGSMGCAAALSLASIMAAERKSLEKEKEESAKKEPVRQQGRNETCQCGSGKKFKKCCLRK